MHAVDTFPVAFEASCFLATPAAPNYIVHLCSGAFRYLPKARNFKCLGYKKNRILNDKF